MAKPLISIVTPVYNEAPNINYYFERMNPVLKQLEAEYEFEFVFTDNRSTDATFALLKEKSQTDPRVRAFRFSRNFGYQKSILTGYTQARGAAAIEFDCDLQDPPELLNSFLTEWRAGNQIVYGVRRTRQEGFFVSTLRKIFYRLLCQISDHHIPVDAGDFMLLDRKVLNLLKQVSDQNAYLRGIIFGFGFSQTPIPYDRQARKHGNSKFPFRKMLALAVDGIISQSTVPLRIATYFGFLTSITTILLGLFYVILRMSHQVDLPGFTTTVVLILISIGLNSMFLGVIGEYLARIYQQVKYKPLTVIDEMTGTQPLHE